MDLDKNIINETLWPHRNYTLNGFNDSKTVLFSPNGTFEFDEFEELGELGPPRDPLYVVIPITFVYMLIFVTGVVGNISTCIVISKNRSMHTATNYYLFSLAVSDFCLLLSGVPQEVYQIWSKYPYVFGEVFCVVRGLMAETSANATVLTITSFTVERYLAICHPFLQHTMSKLSRAIKLILIVWVVSLALAAPMALQFGVMSVSGVVVCDVKRVIIDHAFELSTLLFFLTPMTLITVLYVLIGLKLRSSCLMKRENGMSVRRRTHVNSCRQQNSLGTRRVIKMLVAVVVAFILCWAPFHAQRLVAFYDNDQPILYAIITYTSGILYYLSTCINPLLYNLMSNKFREAFKETLASCGQVSKRANDKKRTYRVLSRSQRRWNTTQDSGNYSGSLSIAGSSIRGESLYSASTQKQSFDSMTTYRSESINLAKNAKMLEIENGSNPYSVYLEMKTSIQKDRPLPTWVIDNPSEELRQWGVNAHELPAPENLCLRSLALVQLFEWRRPSQENANQSTIGQTGDADIVHSKHIFNLDNIDQGFVDLPDSESDNSNRCFTDVEEGKDELSAYMDEIRLREKR